jgi:hypothetical protein
MSVVRVGSTGSYAEGWEAIFGGRTGGVRKKLSAAPKTRPTAAKAKNKSSAGRKQGLKKLAGGGSSPKKSAAKKRR